MHDVIEKALSTNVQRDRVETAARARRAGSVTRAERSRATSGRVVIRFARPDDAAKLESLGRLDADRRTGERLARLAESPTDGGVLVAEVEGDLIAALVSKDGDVVADPFRPSAGIVELLRTRADQLAGASQRRSFLPTRAALRLRLH
jgi:hypothetical protein